ncbi:MAG TPA: hypothetical protein VGP64_15170 [Polyangia bacterium]|jgi:hypothetical protein
MGVGRLVWGSGLLVGCVLAGCSAQSLTPNRDGGAPPETVSPGPDAGTDGGPVVRLVPTSLLTNADLSTAQVLAADRDGIYWVTLGNQLWMLPTGSSAPIQLAVDPSPSSGGDYAACLLVRDDELFWTASIYADDTRSYFRSPLHRTDKTGGDVVLLPNLSGEPREVTADDNDLYFPGGGLGDGVEIAALPLHALPGATPTVLSTLGFDVDVYSMAVDDTYLYWTTFPNDSTIQVDEGPVTRADKASLLAGAGSLSQFIDDDVAAMQAAGGSLFFSYASPGRDAGVGRVDQNGSRTNLPLPWGTTLLVLDRWVVTAVPATSVPPGGLIRAVSIGAVVGDGSVAVEIADQVKILPVAGGPGGPGLVFVDGSGHLLAVSEQDLGAAVAAGQY